MCVLWVSISDLSLPRLYSPPLHFPDSLFSAALFVVAMVTTVSCTVKYQIHVLFIVHCICAFEGGACILARGGGSGDAFNITQQYFSQPHVKCSPMSKCSTKSPMLVMDTKTTLFSPINKMAGYIENVIDMS